MEWQDKLKRPKKYAHWFCKWAFLSVIMGIVGGLLGAVFHHVLHFVTHLRLAHTWLVLLLPITLIPAKRDKSRPRQKTQSIPTIKF